MDAPPGGESRKSFHGYPDGFAQLVESPQSWSAAGRSTYRGSGGWEVGKFSR
jgi:hypothetical protein